MDTSALSYDRPTALLEATYLGVARDLLLVIDWEERTISAETRDPEERTCSEYRWRGREVAYILPPLVDATALRAWVEEVVVPRVAPLVEAYQTVYEDVEAFGRFPGREREKEEFDRWMATEAAPPLHDGGLWTVSDWLADETCGVRVDSTDEDLQDIATDLRADALNQDIVLVGGEAAVLVRLKEIREAMQDAPAPDLYQIRGYEAIERVVKPTGTSARVWVPKAWAGKRVKIVRIEP